MRNIKGIYKTSLTLILLLYIVLLATFIYKCNPIQETISMTAIFVALFTGILAVSIGDKRANKIDFSVQVFGNKNKNRGEHKKLELAPSIRKHFIKHGAIIYTYMIYFKFRNSSDFALKKPTITIKVPNSVKHPSEDNKRMELRSNMFNSPQYLQPLEYGETTVLSNSILPFLHSNEDIKIWIRMCFNKDDTKLINFYVSLDSENAEGKVIKISRSPKDILNQTE